MTRKKADAPLIIRTREQDRLALKKKVRMFYDIQRLRLQTAGRTYDRPEQAPIELHEYDVATLDRRAAELEAAEKNALHDVDDHLKSMPFYRKVLSDKERFKGIGPTMAGVILAEFDIHREDTPSKMWAFAGLAPKPAFRCRACHVVVEEDGTHPAKAKCKETATYPSGKSAKPERGEKLPYNAFLRTKLVGVMGGNLLKCGSPWRKYYDDYKHRKQTQGWGVSDGHRHNAAIRYMVKMLLLEIWKEWREHEGLPVRPSYHEEKQGGHGFKAVG